MIDESMSIVLKVIKVSEDVQFVRLRGDEDPLYLFLLGYHALLRYTRSAKSVN